MGPTGDGKPPKKEEGLSSWQLGQTEASLQARTSIENPVFWVNGDVLYWSKPNWPRRCELDESTVGM